MAAGVGNSSTLTITGSAFTGATALVFELYSIDGIALSIPMLDDTRLSDVGFERKIPGKVVAHGGFSADVEWSPVSASNFATHLTNATGHMFGKPATITIDFAHTGTLTGTKARYVGSGCVTGYTTPTLGSNQKMQAKVMLEFDGVTGPTLTHES